MEAPEKIYLTKNLLGELRDGWDALPSEVFTNVEYTRTDAFIEEVVSYLNSKLYDWVQTTNPNQRSCANTIMKQDFIEDFKNYIKGE